MYLAKLQPCEMYLTRELNFNKYLVLGFLGYLACLVYIYENNLK